MNNTNSCRAQSERGHRTSLQSDWRRKKTDKRKIPGHALSGPVYHIVMERKQGPDKKTKNTEQKITKTKNQEQKINIYSFCLFFDLFLTFPGKPRHKKDKYCSSPPRSHRNYFPGFPGDLGFPGKPLDKKSQKIVCVSQFLFW